jgi:FKBP-type peptidyl-prolyl cis-trans isomerase (trigger factor)
MTKKATNSTTSKSKNKKNTKKNGRKIDSLVAPNTTITLTIPWQKVGVAYQKQLAKLAKNLKTDGFRKGKVPVSLAEQMIDQNKLLQATLEAVFPEEYGKTIEKEGYAPLTQPDVNPKNLQKNQDWMIEVQFAQEPKVSITGYKKIIEKAKKEANKKVNQKPSKNKSESKEHSKAHSNAQHRENLLHHIFTALVQEFKPAIPELLIREHTRQELHELEQQLKQVNSTIDQFIAQKKQSFSELTQELAAQTLGKLQLEFVLRAIQKDLKITVSQEQILSEYEQIISGHNTQTSQKKSKLEKSKKTNLPPMSDSSKAYIHRVLERRFLLEKIAD